MAAAVDKSEMCLEFGRIPVIDMQHFSQDEINMAAQSSDAYRFDDIVIPNIDYSTFNESTGSTNETYSNQFLLQSKEELANLTRRRAGHLSVSRQQNVLNENEKNDVRWVLELIKEFQIKGEHAYKSPSALNIPLLNTGFRVHNLPVDQENSNLKAHNSLQLIVRDPASQTVDDALANSALNADGSVPITDSGLGRSKKRIKTKEGARRKPFMNCNKTVDEQMFIKTAGSNAENTAYLTHGFNKFHGSNNEKAEKDDIDAPVNNVGSNIVSPHISNEPMVPQFKRKVKPLATEAELQEFFNNIGGEWASNMKRRKIVDAEDFAEGFPKGWKLLLGVRKKHGKFIIECRKYMSPDGLQFASCREVTLYLSNAGNSSVSVVTTQDTPCHAESSDDHQNTVAGMSVEENVMKESQVMQPVGGAMLTGVLSTGNNAEVHSREFNNSAISGMETPIKICRRENSSGSLDMASNSKKRHNPTGQNYPMNCKKCNGTFSNRSAFMGHLSIHHVKKKKVVADKTITDGAILTNGKYECQICHKVFDERNRYTGHVGVHSRKNMKRPQDALDQTGIETKAGLDDKETSNCTGTGNHGLRAKQIVKRPRFSLDQTGTETKADLNDKNTSDNKQELQIKADHNQDILETKVIKEQSSVENSYLAYLGAEGNGLASSSIGGFLGGLDSDSGKDRENFSAGNEKFDAIAGFGKIHMYNSSPKFSSFEACQDAIDAEFGDVLQQVESPPGEFTWYLPSRENTSSQFGICFWCNEEFIPDGVDQDQQDDSVQKMCPNCKAKSATG